MKITKQQLKQIIKEEIENMDEAWKSPGAPKGIKSSHDAILKALAMFPPGSALRKEAEKELAGLVYTEPETQMTLGHATGKEIGLEEKKK